MVDKVKNWFASLPDTLYGVNIKQPTTYLVIGFIVLLIFMFATEEADAAETTLEITPAIFVAGDRYTGGLIAIEERWKGKYALGLGLTTKWQCTDDCRRENGKTNQFVYAQRIVQHNKFEMGFGISYWHNLSPSWSSHTPFALHVGWNFNDHVNLKWRHFSTGGSSDRNGGLDLLMVGWRF